MRKAASHVGNASLVDLYGTLVSSRLLVPNDLARLDARSLSLYHFKQYVDNGSMPLPIFTAIFHGKSVANETPFVSLVKLNFAEIPASLEKPLADTQKKQHQAVDEDRKEVLRQEEEEIQELSSWLWFEFTPYEVGSDRLGGQRCWQDCSPLLFSCFAYCSLDTVLGTRTQI